MDTQDCYQKKSTQGVSNWLWCLWYLSSLLFLIYAWLVDLAIPFLLQANVFCILTLLCFLQYFYYDRAWSLLRCCLFALLVLTVSSLLALAIGLGIQSMKRNKDAVILVLGIIPGILSLVAYLPQIYELWHSQLPYGLSIRFLLVDLTGAACFLTSLLLTPPVNWTAASIYIMVLLLDGGIIITLLFWRLLLHRRRTYRQEEEVVDVVTVEGSVL